MNQVTGPAMKNLLVTGASLVLTSAVFGHAYFQKKQFFPTVVHVTKSSPGIAVLYFQAFILMVMVGKLLKKVFFGELRQIEVEHLIERSWYTVTETCLAFTVFRDDFTPKFVALFVILFFLKSFHWLAEERVDFMERSPVISLLFHVRIISLLAVLSSLDINFISFAFISTVTKGASVQLVFGFEYAVLLIALLNVVIKYILHFTDLRRQVPWEHKAVFLLYTELIMSFLKVTLYALFAFVMFRMFTLPVFVLRSMYYTVREFRKALSDVVLSRRAIRNMNTLYPDATPEELSAEDNLCIICREEMTVGVTAKKLPCNHIFHTNCLRSWFQRQQTCPTCRLNILRTPPPIANNPPPQEPRNPVNPPESSSNNEQNPGSSQNMDGHAAGPSGNIPPSSTIPGPNLPFFPPFNQMLFNLAPPAPPLERLTDEELRIFERQLRKNLETRIRCLQNVQTLLDTSLVMFQQYNSISEINSFSTPVNEPSSNVTNQPSKQDRNAMEDETSPPHSAASQSQSAASSSQSAASPSQSAASPTIPSSDTGSASSSKDDELNLRKDQKDIRKRRLEMFDRSNSPHS